jgi:4-amino-4-deoxy-L-arabinose transferase-like glycosyltransferase
MSNQIQLVQGDSLRRYASFKAVFERFQRKSGCSTALGVFICRSLQAILGAEFVLALIASLRFTHTISPAALLVDGTFLSVAGVLCFLVATSRIDLGVSRFAQRNFFPMLIVLGVVLRLVWVLIMPPVQLSDAKDYLTLAHTLLTTGSYVDFETGHRLLAFRAPGYPAFLALSMRLLGDNTWMPTASNMVLFVGSAVVLSLAANNLGDKRSALVALLLFVLWPTDVFITGLAVSEPLTLLLFTAALWLFSLSDVHGAKASMAAGIVGGAAALTRPTLLLFPLLWAVFALAGPNLLGRLRHVMIASLMMVATLAPWTVRNYRMLHAFVPVSTNGGDVFYRANNNLATGGYTPAAEHDLNALQDESEVKWSVESYRQGKAWIRTHPFKFVKLALHKAVYFAKDDEDGIYWSMARAHHNVGPAYMALEVLSDAWWQLLCLLGLFAIWHTGLLPHADAALFASGFVLLLLVHLIYESHSRYRMPGVGLLIVVIAASLCSAPRAVGPAGHGGSQLSQ